MEESRSEGHPAHAITVAHRAIVELKLNPQNPRLHSPRQLRQIGEIDFLLAHQLFARTQPIGERPRAQGDQE